MKAFLNGAMFNFVERGPHDSPHVIFLHGFPFSHEMWSQQIDLVSRKFHTTAYDIRGHGFTDVGDGQYTIEGHVDDLIALLDHLKVQKTVIVGLSMGGYITLRALQRNPERFVAAILCDTRSEPDPDGGKLRRFEAIGDVKKNGSQQFADTFVKAVFADQSFARHPERVASIRKIIARTPPLSIAGTLLALASRTDTTPGLSAIRIPTLILVGEHDATTPPSASRAMHERIPGSQLVIVPDAAHMSNLENPEFFNRHLMEFLEKVPR